MKPKKFRLSYYCTEEGNKLKKTVFFDKHTCPCAQNTNTKVEYALGKLCILSLVRLHPVLKQNRHLRIQQALYVLKVGPKLQERSIFFRWSGRVGAFSSCHDRLTESFFSRTTQPPQLPPGMQPLLLCLFTLLICTGIHAIKAPVFNPNALNIHVVPHTHDVRV